MYKEMEERKAEHKMKPGESQLTKHTLTTWLQGAAN